MLNVNPYEINILNLSLVVKLRKKVIDDNNIRQELIDLKIKPIFMGFKNSKLIRCPNIN